MLEEVVLRLRRRYHEGTEICEVFVSANDTKLTTLNRVTRIRQDAAAADPRISVASIQSAPFMITNGVKLSTRVGSIVRRRGPMPDLGTKSSSNKKEALRPMQCWGLSFERSQASFS